MHKKLDNSEIASYFVKRLANIRDLSTHKHHNDKNEVNYLGTQKVENKQKKIRVIFHNKLNMPCAQNIITMLKTIGGWICTGFRWCGYPS